MPNIQFLLYLSLTFTLITTYVEFQILRNPHQSKKLPLSKSQCQDPSTVASQAKYVEICYEKDIAYVFEFDHLNKKKYLALDLTSPVSWIKDSQCKMIDNNKQCTLLKENFNQKLKGIFKQKITDLISKLKKKIENDDSKAIIEGSNQIVMGEVDQIKNLSIVGRNHQHFQKLFDVILLGLYIIGENDNMTINSTTFIKAHKITPNLNSICDGAISLRFEQNSEKSFLNEVFEFLKSQKKNKIISIYLGKDKNVVTIGGMSPKYAENGLSSFTRVKMEQSQYGKLPHMQGIIFQNNDDQTTIEADSQIIFTLSSSYISFTKDIIGRMLKQFFPSTLKCKINNESFIECSNKDKEDVQSLKSSSLNIDLDTSMIHFQMKDLVLKDDKNGIIFNIKQSQCNNSIVGEPFFLKYYVYFDYNKNEIGYSLRKLTIEEHFISALTLIHFVMVSMLFGSTHIIIGFCFLISTDPFKRLYRHIFQRIVDKTRNSIKDTWKTYQPVIDQQEDRENQKEKTPRLEDVEGI